jgi:protein-disulfide isomerase
MSKLKAPITADDHIKGPPEAPVTLVEYGDYECAHCGAAHPVVKLVLRHFGPRLRFVYRHFPLTQIHLYAAAAAETAEFASASGKFWLMHDAIFENQHWLSLPLLLTLAEAVGLSQSGLQDALAARQYAPKVRNDLLGGMRSGVNGTPTFFIDGSRHDGSVEELNAAIDLRLRLEPTVSSSRVERNE